MKKIVIATKNAGKFREIRGAFRDLPVEMVALDAFGALPDAVEDGVDFAENAATKARFFQRQTGLACLADDSGLEVDALGGAPGVYSARFAGWHADDGANNEALLRALAKAGVTESGAAYRCALALCDVDGTLLAAEGSCQGVVKNVARGTNGFGYDPYFYIGERTMAELGLEEKKRISHRGAALREMAKKLEEYLK